MVVNKILNKNEVTSLTHIGVGKVACFCFFIFYLREVTYFHYKQRNKAIVTDVAILSDDGKIRKTEYEKLEKY